MAAIANTSVCDVGDKVIPESTTILKVLAMVLYFKFHLFQHLTIFFFLQFRDTS